MSFLAVYHSALTLQVIHGVSNILGLIHLVIFYLPSVSHLIFERIVQGWNRKSVLWNHKGNVFKGAAYLKQSSDNYPKGMPHVLWCVVASESHYKTVQKTSWFMRFVGFQTSSKP